MRELASLLADARACTVCREHLPMVPRPVLAADAESRIAVIGQAPGTRVQETGVPWDDDSGAHLQTWLGVDRATFMDTSRFAILPMGFCYPGKKKGGDAPPRPECAPLWHPPILEALPKVRLTLLIGQYAQKHYLGKDRKKTLTATVQAYEQYLPTLFPLPHPSWRSRIWMKKNPWFETEVLPVLRHHVTQAMT